MRALVAAAAVLAVTGTALADGGPPMTLGVAFHRKDPHSLYVMTNYGVMISHDDGCTFGWVCEANAGYGGAYIPEIGVTDDGALLLTSYPGLRVSRDGGCTFETAAAPAGGISVEHLAVAANGDVWVTTSEAGRTNDVLVSHDNARTFAPGGLASETILWGAIRVAPSDPSRVYVAGRDGTTSILRRRDGADWVPAALVGLGTNFGISLAAIDPADPDILYLIAHDAVPGGDKLYRSADGGATVVDALTVNGQIRDVLATGSDVYVTRQISEGPRVVGGAPYRSSDRGATFVEAGDAPRLMCLATAPDGALVGCGANWQPDYKAIARFDGTAWTKVWRFVELAGPLACGPGTGGAKLCTDLFSNLDVTLQTTGPVCGPLAPDGGLSSPPPPADVPGCCESSTSRPTGLIWAFALMFWLRRRRV